MPEDNNTVTINGRSYPSRYPPGIHWATDEAWRILDMIKDEVISTEIRAFLSGAIAGALMKERAEGKTKHE